MPTFGKAHMQNAFDQFNHVARHRFSKMRCWKEIWTRKIGEYECSVQMILIKEETYHMVLYLNELKGEETVWLYH